VTRRLAIWKEFNVSEDIAGIIKSFLMMEAAYSYKTLVNIYQTA
jgi:hypothetical protein